MTIVRVRKLPEGFTMVDIRLTADENVVAQAVDPFWDISERSQKEAQLLITRGD